MSTLSDKLEELLQESISETVRDAIQDELDSLRSDLESEIEDAKYSAEQQVDSAVSDLKDDITAEVMSDLEDSINEVFDKKIQDWSKNEGLGLTENDRRWIGDLITAIVDERIYKTLTKLVDASNPTKQNYHNVI